MTVSKKLKITKQVLKTHRYTDEREGGRERERRDREREGMRARGDRGA